ncbi:PrpF protein [Epithele typhae]|uniref:PrpF protein n=1 Tax=Epithele typhae TaxID=378194 RepID=UPI002008B518|nr:PrpF protein [Epithele typhae]KAH9945093.1 PrpF protein [Epithele typhae]
MLASVLPRCTPRTATPIAYARRFQSHLAGTLPATFLRGGTSKGIFLKREDVPEDPAAWTPIFQGIMGSPDDIYRRQLNGMGGGVSSLSKVVVVGPPTSPAADYDVEYTFVQVGIDDGALDLSGNCGNLSSMVGVFALDHALCAPRLAGDSATVRCLNTNTNKLIETTFPVLPGTTAVADLARPEAETAGVPGKASQILLKFVRPGGARTGKLLPSGRPRDALILPLHSAPGLSASLVDATNPTVFVAAPDLARALGIGLGRGDEEAAALATSAHLTRPDVATAVERVRQAGARAMGLDPLARAQPKIAVLREPTDEELARGVDVGVHAFSMGVVHKAVPMTVGLCLGVAAGVPGTLAAEIVRRARERRGVVGGDGGGLVRICHPGGVVDVGAEFDEAGEVVNAQVVRTGRRLMEGSVWY